MLPAIRRKDLPVVHLPRQTRSQGGKTKLTNHRAAIILHAISCGCDRETAAELASIKAETLSHWMGWSGEPYETFQAWCGRPKLALNRGWSRSSPGRLKSDPSCAGHPRAKVPAALGKSHGGGGTASPSELQRRRHPPESSRTDRSRPRSRSASPGHHHQRQFSKTSNTNRSPSPSALTQRLNSEPQPQ